MTKRIKKILWVEDDADRLGGLIMPLNNEYEFTLAFDAQEAMNYLNKYTYDLILLDLILPQGNDEFDEPITFVGVKILENISQNLARNVPIIVLSVVRDEDVISKIMKFNVEAILPKGRLRPSELKKEIENVLDK